MDIENNNLPIMPPGNEAVSAEPNAAQDPDPSALVQAVVDMRKKEMERQSKLREAILNRKVAMLAREEEQLNMIIEDKKRNMDNTSKPAPQVVDGELVKCAQCKRVLLHCVCEDNTLKK